MRTRPSTRIRCLQCRTSLPLCRMGRDALWSHLEDYFRFPSSKFFPGLILMSRVSLVLPPFLPGFLQNHHSE